MDLNTFLAWEQASRDTIDFKKVYVDVAGDLVAGLMLSQIVFWHMPDRNGRPKLKVSKRDPDTQEWHLWLVKSRTEWWDECRVTEYQVDRALKLLADKEIIAVRRFRFNNAPTTHLRLCWDRFLELFEEQLQHQPSYHEFSDSRNSPSPNFDKVELGKLRNSEMGETLSSEFGESPISEVGETPKSITETTQRSAVETTTERGRDAPRRDTNSPLSLLAPPEAIAPSRPSPGSGRRSVAATVYEQYLLEDLRTRLPADKWPNERDRESLLARVEASLASANPADWVQALDEWKAGGYKMTNLSGIFERFQRLVGRGERVKGAGSGTTVGSGRRPVDPGTLQARNQAELDRFKQRLKGGNHAGNG